MSDSRLFDLGIRLRAAKTGEIQPRLAATPYVKAAPLIALAVTADGKVTIQRPGRPAVEGVGPAALAPLAQIAPRNKDDNDRPMHTLVVADGATLRRAVKLARTIDPADPELGPVGALLTWWSERAEHPDTQALINVVRACRARWITGVHPDLERSIDTWRTWLGVTAAGTAALLAIATRLREGTPLPGVYDDKGVLNGDDRYTWSSLGYMIDKGADWRRSDSQKRQVIGLLTRATAADVHDRRLLEDSCWQSRSVWTGTAMRATVTHAGVDVTVRSVQTNCKFKLGQRLELSAASRTDAEGAPIALTVVVERLDADAATGQLSVVVRASSKKNGGLLALLMLGDAVLLLPELITTQQNIRKKMVVSKRMEIPHWTRSGNAAPKRVERDVPLDVIVAAHGAG